MTWTLAVYVSQVLFCGREFLDGFNFTAEELASEEGVSVKCCARSEVHQHIADADMAVRAMLCGLWCARWAAR